MVLDLFARRGNCLDYSPMERLFRSLKSEWGSLGGYPDIYDAIRDITQYLGGYYNHHCPHSYMGGFHLLNMKDGGKRLRKCPDFVGYYIPR
ncbi:hypothetical protein H8A87_11135 [Xenorhabdus sp. VLS]|uniref:Transposase n=1 Tax=Xenorhabdus lircayensis TaxID=2763499 RepID=A0ABS0U911_9GAMM|nr:hypothetical protein [Xenorhabdus lircayensis]